MADLTVSYEAAVNEEVEAGINSLEGEHHFLTAKLPVYKSKGSRIHARGVLVGNVRRICWIWIIYVCVIRCIKSAVKRILPIHRHGKLIILAEYHRIRILYLGNRGIKFKAPLAYESLEIIRLVAHAAKRTLLIGEGYEIRVIVFACYVKML